MLNKTKAKLDNMITDYPEYRRELNKLKPLLEVATDLSRERLVSFPIIRAIVHEVKSRITALEILCEFN